VSDPRGHGEVYFEIVGIGRNLKVTAIDAATGVEVVVIGPATASHADLRQLACASSRPKFPPPAAHPTPRCGQAYHPGAP
jgi:hypothetical protein